MSLAPPATRHPPCSGFSWFPLEAKPWMVSGGEGRRVKRNGSPSGGGARDQKPPGTAGPTRLPFRFRPVRFPFDPGGMPGSAVVCSAQAGRGAVRMGLAIGSRPYAVGGELAGERRRGGPSLRVVPRLSAPTEHNTRVRRPLSRRRACPLHRPPTCRLGPCAEEERAEAGPRVTCDVAMDGPLIIDLRAGLKSYGWRRIWPAAPRGFSKFLPNIFEKLNFFQGCV